MRRYIGQKWYIGPYIGPYIRPYIGPYIKLMRTCFPGEENKNPTLMCCSPGEEYTNHQKPYIGPYIGPYTLHALQTQHKPYTHMLEGWAGGWVSGREGRVHACA